MSISWDGRKGLVRLAGIADELLVSSRGAQTAEVDAALSRQLSALMQEVHGFLAEDDPVITDEFDRVVLSSDESPPELRAAALVGWLKAALVVESLEEEREEDSTLGAKQSPRRKQTIGFRIRSPITRETTSAEQDGPTTS